VDWWYKQLICGFRGHPGTYFVRFDKIKRVRILKCAYCGKIVEEKVCNLV